MTAPAERRCRRCGATSGLRLIVQPLAITYREWECADGCPATIPTDDARIVAGTVVQWLVAEVERLRGQLADLTDVAHRHGLDDVDQMLTRWAAAGYPGTVGEALADEPKADRP